jgi:hypothetical protein
VHRLTVTVHLPPFFSLLSQAGKGRKPKEKGEEEKKKHVLRSAAAAAVSSAIFLFCKAR